jgi:hypothetical protein
MHSKVVASYLVWYPVKYAQTLGEIDLERPIKVFDFTRGKFVGHVELPKKDKCLQFRHHNKNYPLNSLNMCVFSSFCKLLDQSGYHLTTYNATKSVDGPKFVWKLFQSNTLFLAERRISLFWDFLRVFERDAIVILRYSSGLEIITLSNILHGLNPAHRQSFPGNKRVNSATVRMGIIFWTSRSYTTRLGWFEIRCSKNSSRNHSIVVKQLYIQFSIEAEINMYEDSVVRFDKHMDIFRIKIDKWTGKAVSLFTDIENRERN